jgi:nucleotide sugar dehydrogenase
MANYRKNIKKEHMDKIFITKSPYLDIYEYQINNEQEVEKIDSLHSNNKTTVVVQGLGFVGSAMVAALSNVLQKGQETLYNVIGVDLANENSYWKIARANEGKSPIISNDINMDKAYQKILHNKNFLATHSEYAYYVADIVVVDIHLDIKKNTLENIYDYSFSYDEYQKSIEVIANNIKEDALVLIETTVPPGTTQKVIYPIFKHAFEKRGLDINKLCLAHSYERVMPGKNYLKSITDYYRVYSGIDKKSKEKARVFLESFINTTEYPLTELHSTTASEMSKVLENSYRAMNIAFIQEWTQYAQKADVDLFEVIDAIKVRHTHNNMMLPGFGVGGYCLTKDSLLADWSYKNLFCGDGHLDMSMRAINTNDLMPKYTFDLLSEEFSSLSGLNIALLGVSYLNDVADTRYSPSALFYEQCLEHNMNVFIHDPIVQYWEEKNIKINQDLISLKDKNIDIVVLTVRHQEYLNLDVKLLLSIFDNVKLVIDGFNILSDSDAKLLSQHGTKVIGVGKGHWKDFYDRDINE